MPSESSHDEHPDFGEIIVDSEIVIILDGGSLDDWVIVRDWQDNPDGGGSA